MMKKALLLLSHCALSAAIAAAVVYGYHRHYAPRIVALDVRGYIGEQRQLYLDGKLSQTDLDANLSRVRVIVETLPNNAVALVSDVVIKNAEIIKLKP